ncbi:MAG: alkaline phosphatase family protein [Elusimicrobiota bacterium]
MLKILAAALCMAWGLDGVPEIKDAGPVIREAKGTLVLIQVDGLSYDRFLEAASKGKVPNMAALLDSGFKLSPYKCGIPTITQSVQAQIFYGVKLPANDWYSKKGASGGGKAYTGGVDFERRLSKPGLLSGGRVYLSELAGGAKDGVDVSSFIQEDAEAHGGTIAYLRNLRKGSLLRLLHKWPGIKRDAREMAEHFRESGFDTELDAKAPLFISIMENYCSSVAEDGVKKAISDDAPVVYTDLASYDEKAHYFGPSSDAAFDALKRIDERVGRIAAEAGARGARLFIFSDHGQTESEVFSKRFGKAMQQLVDELARKVYPKHVDGDLAFTHAYSMGNIYLIGHDGHVDKAGIERFYPGFLKSLSEHEGVGMVAVRSEGKVELLGGSLAGYADSRMPPEVLKAQIEDYMSLEESGDIVVFAPYKDGRTLDYNDKYTLVSEHGGIGGEQMHPFILYDPKLMAESPASWKDAGDLHRVFKSLLP